ncbi:acidic phospholipase A2 2-like [Branchiostoma floridae]|uniref:Phospholipase A2 n=1 Tax=Branchiostoma floridae TaxID=7739 RepID=A0A9J7HVT5_BRAFL|nr:acidic phospholipase A2 2-like [Branchiostoma floridae]
MWWKLLLVICAVAAFNIGANADPTSELRDEPRHRQKRNIRQLARMIEKVTGRNAKDYNKYGCWCGRGGAGEPVDGIDTCCKAHDECYETVDRPYRTTYNFAVDAGVVTCEDDPGTNERAVCDCDRTAVLCFNANVYPDPPVKPACP